MTTWMGSAVASGEDSYKTATQAAKQAVNNMGHLDQIKLTVVFASSSHQLQQVVDAIRAVTHNAPLIGCSSSGAFAGGEYEAHGIAVSTIASDDCKVNLGKASDYVRDIPNAVESATRDFHLTNDDDASADYMGRTLFLLVDGLAGHAENLIDELIAKSGVRYQLFGGAAADELQFQSTHVFMNNEVLTNTFVCAELLTEKPLSIVARHGWKPMSGPYRATHCEESVVYELSGRSAWETYQSFAAKEGIQIRPSEESAFLMRYILGIQTENGFKLRVPLGLNPDGSLSCAAEISEGDIVYIMTADDGAIIEGSALAVKNSIISSGGDTVAGALNLECVATCLHLGERFQDQIDATASVINPGAVAGCACFGQLVRTNDEFDGLGCATSLVCLIPK